jgi:septum formation protein
LTTLADPLILASQSPYRSAVLAQTGFAFTHVSADVDESALKQSLTGQSPEAVAVAVARAKGSAVSALHPDAIVIAADQLCVVDHHCLSKPMTADVAIQQLTQLANRSHQLVNGMVLFRHGTPLWESTQTCTLHMRALTDAEIAHYVHCDEPYFSCGAYKFESLGIHLFSEVEGTSDAIQGLPLLPLLSAMRAHQLYQL